MLVCIILQSSDIPGTHLVDVDYKLQSEDRIELKNF